MSDRAGDRYFERIHREQWAAELAGIRAVDKSIARRIRGIDRNWLVERYTARFKVKRTPGCQDLLTQGIMGAFSARLGGGERSGALGNSSRRSVVGWLGSEVKSDATFLLIIFAGARGLGSLWLRRGSVPAHVQDVLSTGSLGLDFIALLTFFVDDGALATFNVHDDSRS
jgi:hypothetical protein